MNETILAYIYDFLSMAFEDSYIKEKINEVILFGSVAKESYDKKSDIDLFFDIKIKEETDAIEERLKVILGSFEVKAEKTWKLKGVKLPIKFIVGSLGDKTWENLREEIISSGILLYGSYKELPEDIKHYFLFYYSLRDLNRKNKMKFIRNLFGYRIMKDRKEYKQAGLLEKIGGSKLSSNAILVPLGDLSRVKKLFNDFKVKYKIMETWVRI
ncbi:MAG: nucleotidyltransferase domain-containing protein [Nanoarchaeota archaeon]|nr:nucleotidyltransferase domain-containing protein [Nanoarchaeota archaeon]MBU1004527.1 nucleotidyltransferase domain-containing protein [Nanoarchaeota archaeon]MBU1945936.1 nucleotidyltransferase domain-containing protein [Nanoarchaeota archaeon]